MIFVDELKSGFEVMLHPSKKTKKRIKTGEALKYYYKFSFIPMILEIILSILILNSVPLYMQPLPQGIGVVVLVMISVVLFWMLMPLGIVVFAAIIQVIGRLFGMFKGKYSDSLTSVVYGALPGAGLFWLADLPVIGAAVLIVAFVWGLYVTVAALSNQQGTRKLGAFGVILVSGVVLFVIALALLMILGLLFAP
jgi:hypothetical protein